jgi:putative DNA-binding protein
VLRELQLAFLDAVRAGDGGAGGLALRIAGDDRMDARGRLGIYADMYRLRLAAALAATVPQTAAALGEAGFAALAAAYFDAHPSRSPSLRNAGAQLAAFMSRRGDGWLADLARLEWGRYDVFDAVDEPILDEATARARGPEGIAELQVRLVRAHAVIEVEHAIEPAWRALMDGAPAGVPERSPRSLLVWREGSTVYHRAVDAVERAALGAAAAGLSFGALCERLADLLPPAEAAQRTGALLLRWLRDQLLVDDPA